MLTLLGRHSHLKRLLQMCFYYSLSVPDPTLFNFINLEKSYEVVKISGDMGFET